MRTLNMNSKGLIFVTNIAECVPGRFLGHSLQSRSMKEVQIGGGPFHTALESLGSSAMYYYLEVTYATTTLT
jgi:hypothetical protein